MMPMEKPLNTSPVPMGRVSRMMIPPAYSPRRLPPMICPTMNCHRGVGEIMTWSKAFSYSRWTFRFWAMALKLPFMVVSATTPGIRKFKYGSPWEIVWMPRPNTTRYISGAIMAAMVIL